jgi:hypothetical protein
VSAFSAGLLNPRLSADDPGCVKTPRAQQRGEWFSYNETSMVNLPPSGMASRLMIAIHDRRLELRGGDPGIPQTACRHA